MMQLPKSMIKQKFGNTWMTWHLRRIGFTLSQVNCRGPLMISLSERLEIRLVLIPPSVRPSRYVSREITLPTRIYKLIILLLNLLLQVLRLTCSQGWMPNWLNPKRFNKRSMCRRRFVLVVISEIFLSHFRSFWIQMPKMFASRYKDGHVGWSWARTLFIMLMNFRFAILRHFPTGERVIVLGSPKVFLNQLEPRTASLLKGGDSASQPSISS